MALRMPISRMRWRATIPMEKRMMMTLATRAAIMPTWLLLFASERGR